MIALAKGAVIVVLLCLMWAAVANRSQGAAFFLFVVAIVGVVFFPRDAGRW